MVRLRVILLMVSGRTEVYMGVVVGSVRGLYRAGCAVDVRSGSGLLCGGCELSVVVVAGWM